MPLYIYVCRLGHETEQRRGLEESSIPCPRCNATAPRQAVYVEQYTRTDSGGMQGRMGKAGALSEGAERLARNSMTIAKETGQKSGPVLR